MANGQINIGRKRMGRVSLRQYSFFLILIPAVMGLALTFSDGLLQGTDAEFQDDDVIHDIQSDFGETNQNITDQGRDEASGIDIQTDFFFLSQVWNIITLVPEGIGTIHSIIRTVPTAIGIPIPQALIDIAVGLVSIIAIFGVVSAARGWDV